MPSAEEPKAYTSNQHPLKSANSRGPGAKEIESLRTLSSEQSRTIQQEYDLQQSDVRTLSNRTLFVALGISLVLIFIGGLIRSVGVMSFAYAAYELIKRSGERAAYLDGYTKGLDEGVNRSLGLSSTKTSEAALRSQTDANSSS